MKTSGYLATKKTDKKFYAQYGEDQWLFDNDKILGPGEKPRVACEFGMPRLKGSNTAFLHQFGYELVFGELMEKGAKFVGNQLKKANIHAKIMVGLITMENVNLIVPQNTDILSIDVDGNDYWLWKALKANPRIVIIEYNRNRTDHGTHVYDPYFFIDKTRRKLGLEGPSKSIIDELAEERGYKLIYENLANLIYEKQ